MSKDRPVDIAREMVDYSDIIAENMFKEMPDEECVAMVRDFCYTMMDWQPNISEHKEDPISLGIACLAAAELFKLAFVRAYTHTDKRVSAMEAIKKAFDS